MLSWTCCLAKFDNSKDFQLHQGLWAPTKADSIFKSDFSATTGGKPEIICDVKKLIICNSDNDRSNLGFRERYLTQFSPKGDVEMRICPSKSNRKMSGEAKFLHHCQNWNKGFKASISLRLHSRTCQQHQPLKDIVLPPKNDDTVRSDIWESKSGSDSDDGSLKLSKHVTQDLEYVRLIFSY